METNSNIQPNFTFISTDRVVNQIQLKEELKCRICLGILRLPQECKVCENCFCSQCLKSWLQQSYQCPLKCSENTKFKERPHKIIRNMLEELVIECKNKDQGCECEVRYTLLEDHELRECQYELVRCQGHQDGCEVKLRKYEIKQHEQQCMLVPVNCVFCKKLVKRSQINSHKGICEEMEFNCQHCQQKIKRKNYLVHVNALCEEYTMNCGRCQGAFKRKYKEFHDCVRHLQNCQKTMNEDIQNLKERIIEKDKKICELENRVFFELAEIKQKLNNLALKEEERSNLSSSRIGSQNEQVMNNNMTEYDFTEYKNNK